MKKLITCLMISMSSTVSFAEYTKECGIDFRHLVSDESSRTVLSEREIENRDQLVTLSPLERKSFDLYLDKFSISNPFEDEYTYYELKVVLYKNETNNIGGYRVNVNLATDAEANVRFYYKEKSRGTRVLLQTYWDNQSPERRWICEDYKTPMDKIRSFITDLAHDIGEYFYYDDSEYRKNIKPVSIEDLPSNIKRIAKKAARERAEENGENAYGSDDSASLADEQYLIVKDGKVVGYVISIWDSIDHALWDGSGLHIYFDKNGKEVTSSEWTG